VAPKPLITIQFVTDAYLANRAGRGIAPSTLRKYATFVKQLREFASVKGYVLIEQIQITDMDEFYSRWKDGIRAKAKKLERLNGFFRFCVKRKWIGENPAADLEAPVGSGSAANRMPFTDSELAKIYEACDRLPDVQWKNHLGSGSWGGDDVNSLVMLLCWTGLRIGDGATFDMSRVTPMPTQGPMFSCACTRRRVRSSRGWTIGCMSVSLRESADTAPRSLREACPSD
jgi:site-specific recombinase XerD